MSTNGEPRREHTAPTQPAHHTARPLAHACARMPARVRMPWPLPHHTTPPQASTPCTQATQAPATHPCHTGTTNNTRHHNALSMQAALQTRPTFTRPTRALHTVYPARRCWHKAAGGACISTATPHRARTPMHAPPYQRAPPHSHTPHQHTHTHTHTRALAAPLPQCVCWQRTQPTPANLSAHARTPNTQAHTYTDISACLPSQTPFICACQQVPAWHPLGPQAVRKHMRSLNAAQTGQHVGHALVHAGPLQREHAHTSHNLPAAHSPLHRAKHTQHRHTTCRTKQLAAFPLRTSQ